MEKIILVDFNDKEIGLYEKIEAHQKALLHRAFSVFLIDKDKILLQRRALNKYHCGGLWTNSCCSHVRSGESVSDAAIRRVNEELGINISKVLEIGHFIYNFPFDNGLTEYEYDHVLVAEYKGNVYFNPEEVDSISWVSIEEIEKDLLVNAAAYTPWFITSFKMVEEYLNKGE
jgi:isopentenyl-diphosphate delta-isomerase